MTDTEDFSLKFPELIDEVPCPVSALGKTGCVGTAYGDKTESDPIDCGEPSR